MPEYMCEICERKVTRGPSGKEYGHDRRHRCSKRRSNVDPIKPRSCNYEEDDE